MALLDFASVYSTAAPPSGFTLAGIGLNADQAAEQSQTAADRLGRNYAERFLPDLVSNQAARGAYNTSATRRKVGQLTEDTGDSLSDLALAGGNYQGELASNALLAQTGIRIR